MVGSLPWILATIFFQVAWATVQGVHSTINDHGRILRTERRSLPSEATSLASYQSSQNLASGSKSSVSVFIVTTRDEEHVLMLKNLLCSLFFSPGQAARHQEIFVMLHPGDGDAKKSESKELQQALRNLGYSRLTVLDGQEIFGHHPHWKALKHSFPSNLRVLGIRFVLARMARDARLLVIDEDVVCSPERIHGGATPVSNEEMLHLSVPEEVARRAPAGASVVCAHEIPDVVDVFNNGFCLYKACDATDAFLASVERRMVELQFVGDQTPFNQVVRESADLTTDTLPVLATFDSGVAGYLRTWTATGFPSASAKELLVVDSTAPEVLVQWNATAFTTSLRGPLCIHYLPFSPSTHMWSKLARH